jgi:predicted SnoaL-like aldol condensation-catalyzing enzyme
MSFSKDANHKPKWIFRSCRIAVLVGLIALQPPTPAFAQNTAQTGADRSTATQTVEAKNKALVLEAFDTLFNKKDLVAAERFWSANYIQHSAHVPPGRDGLFNIVRRSPPTLRYEAQQVVAECDLVMLHGRFSGRGKKPDWIVVDILRIEDGRLAEHCDVIEDEATRATSMSGLPMFGSSFPEAH